MRISILVGIAAVIFSMTLGVVLGLLAGYLGGWVDTLIMRLADVQLSFPTIMIAFFIDGVAKITLPLAMREEMRFYVVILAIGVADWVQFARTVRAATMIERSKDYVAAARISHVGGPRILLTHILPNTIGPVLVLATLGSRSCHPDRGDPVVPRARHAAVTTLARHADPRRQRSAAVWRVVDLAVSRRHAGAAGACRQHRRRLAARRAQSPFALT